MTTLALTLLTLGLWLLLGAAGLHLLRSAAWALREGRLGGAPPPPRDRPTGAVPPPVTVQLPMRNERLVAERLLRAVDALDWPRDRLDVQVLDDSDEDDATRPLVARLAAELGQEGLRIRVLRRGDRRGFKAGNLQHGLASAEGEYLLVLDADSVPPPDLLRRLVPDLEADPRAAFAQARWSFLNEDASALTRLQALILHGLFLVEQPRLAASGQPLQFNGTAGVWRKAALLAAGGWLPEGGQASVTEDLDLSYRARLAGYHGLSRPDVAVATELPETMAAFRAQQARWVRGGAEVLRALGRKLLAGQGPAGGRGTMLGHLLRHARQPYLVLFLLVLPRWMLTPLPLPTFAWPLAFILLAIGAYYGAALHRLGRSPLRGLVYAPLLVMISVGLAPALAWALVAGLWGGPGEFVRTPKTGGQKGAAYRSRRSGLAVVEVLGGLFYAVLAAGLLVNGALAAAVGTGLFVATGLLWAGLASLRG